MPHSTVAPHATAELAVQNPELPTSRGCGYIRIPGSLIIRLSFMVKDTVILQLFFFASFCLLDLNWKSSPTAKPTHTGRRGDRHVALKSQLGTSQQQAEVRPDADQGGKLLRV